MTALREPHWILVVDDDHDLRESLRVTLEEEGFATIPACNGREALEILEQGGQPTPDVILLDLMMPVMTGLEVVEQLRADRRFGLIPIVLMTAFRTMAPKRDVSVLLKPLTVGGLISAIHHAG